MSEAAPEQKREAVAEIIYGTITILAVILALDGGGYGAWAVVLSVVVSSYALAFAKLYAGTDRTCWRAAGASPARNTEPSGARLVR